MRLRAVVLGLLPTLALAQPVIEPGSPFVIGELFPDTPATCDTLPDWIDHVPDYDGRISMAIRGRLIESDWDGALAWLVMCPTDRVQVICATYEPLDPLPDRDITLAGGVAGWGEGKLLLDPCLPYFDSN